MNSEVYTGGLAMWGSARFPCALGISSAGVDALLSQNDTAGRAFNASFTLWLFTVGPPPPLICPFRLLLLPSESVATYGKSWVFSGELRQPRDDQPCPLHLRVVSSLTGNRGSPLCPGRDRLRLPGRERRRVRWCAVPHAVVRLRRAGDRVRGAPPSLHRASGR